MHGDDLAREKRVASNTGKPARKSIELFKIHYTVRAEPFDCAQDRLVEAFSRYHALRQAQGERIWFVTNYEKVNRSPYARRTLIV